MKRLHEDTLSSPNELQDGRATQIEDLIDDLLLADDEKLQEAARVVDEFWAGDYINAVAMRGDPDYSILDFAADVIRDATDEDVRQIRSLLLDASNHS